MDVYKLKWKMRFRLKKLKGFFKLCEYNFRHKHNLEGDDQFYYYLQRQLMQDLVKADPEQEYLEEHGLLPEEEPELLSNIIRIFKDIPESCTIDIFGDCSIRLHFPFTAKV